MSRVLAGMAVATGIGIGLASAPLSGGTLAALALIAFGGHHLVRLAGVR